MSAIEAADGLRKYLLCNERNFSTFTTISPNFLLQQSLRLTEIVTADDSTARRCGRIQPHGSQFRTNARASHFSQSLGCQELHSSSRACRNSVQWHRLPAAPTLTPMLLSVQCTPQTISAANDIRNTVIAVFPAPTVAAAKRSFDWMSLIETVSERRLTAGCCLSSS